MSEVFEAINELIGKRVAIKVLRREIAGDERSTKRFLIEARAAASVGHPAIIDIYDMGQAADGAPFIVMEYLEGRSLDDLIGECRTLDVHLTAYIASQVLSALHAAHGKGIIHRDLTPSNVFLVYSGRKMPDVKLLDFGISKILGDGQNTKLTQTGTVLGTPLYMSPEQASGQVDLDHRVDLWAMGIMLYECVTGTVPFAGYHYNDVLAKILTDTYTAPRVLAPAVLPASIESVIASALQKNRDLRCQNAIEMLEDLLPLVDPKGVAQIALPQELRNISRRFQAVDDEESRPTSPSIGLPPPGPRPESRPTPTDLSIPLLDADGSHPGVGEDDDPTVRGEESGPGGSIPPADDWLEDHETEQSIPIVSFGAGSSEPSNSSIPFGGTDSSEPSFSAVQLLDTEPIDPATLRFDTEPSSPSLSELQTFPIDSESQPTIPLNAVPDAELTELRPSRMSKILKLTAALVLLTVAIGFAIGWVIANSHRPSENSVSTPGAGQEVPLRTPTTDASLPLAPVVPPLSPNAPNPSLGTITLRVSGLPEGARVLIDDVELVGPFVEGRLLRDDSRHVVRIEAEGYLTWTRTVVFDRDIILVATMEPAPRKSRRAPRR